jgi:hypothetical protein
MLDRIDILPKDFTDLIFIGLKLNINRSLERP